MEKFRKLGETCASNRNCGSGLHCETCLANSNLRARCTRIQPLNPYSKVKGLPFNRYSWLTTHNSFARLGQKSATGSVVIAPTNQQDSITDQLNTWDLNSAFCLRRGFEFHDDGELVVRAYECENGHVSGAWTDLPIYSWDR